MMLRVLPYLLAFFCLASMATASTTQTKNFCLMTTQAICTRVIDGDTVVLDGTDRLRLCGINAPEISKNGRPLKSPEPYGIQARDLVTSVALGQKLRIELQVRRDKYGRLLGWVWLPGGQLLNAEIVRCGYARPYKGCVPASTMQLINEAAAEAKDHQEGIWQKTE